jgi:hypothetical protein
MCGLIICATVVVIWKIAAHFFATETNLALSPVQTPFASIKLGNTSAYSCAVAVKVGRLAHDVPPIQRIIANMTLFTRALVKASSRIAITIGMAANFLIVPAKTAHLRRARFVIAWGAVSKSPTIVALRQIIDAGSI